MALSSMESDRSVNLTAYFYLVSRLDNVESPLKTVDVFSKYISVGYRHLEVKICKGHV
jgi:hypothetical protein